MPINNEPGAEEKRINNQKIFREKKKGVFGAPSVKSVRTGGVKIIPAHMAIFQNYKDQGFRSLGKAIRKTGVYSEGIANRVSAITKSKSWQAIMQIYLPEEKLALRHAELLDKRDTKTIENIKYNKDGTTKERSEQLVDMGPETNAVSKGLELAYRLRGSFQKEEQAPPSTVMYNLFYKPEVREEMRLFEDKIKLSLLNEINKRNTQEIEAEEERSGTDGGTSVVGSGSEKTVSGSGAENDAGGKEDVAGGDTSTA